MKYYYQKKKPFFKRFIALISALVIVLVCFTGKMVELQIVNADTYLAQADTSSYRTLTVSAARGEIIDRYGRPLVINREGFNIVFDAAYLPTSKLNDTILILTDLLTENEQKWTDNLPLKVTKPYGFSEDMDYSIGVMKSELELNDYATAQNCFDAMITRYKLQGYTASQQRIIMGVRYSMQLADYSISLPFTFAEDVDRKIVEIIEENSVDFTGVVIKAATFREYPDPEVASHLLGTVGLLTAEEWADVKDSGKYNMNDKIGKSGIEYAAEEYLKGQDGKIAIVQTASGETTTEIIRESIAGNTVQLTIDKNLQKVAQQALKESITQINEENRKTSSEHDVTGAAVVVTEVQTGEILAAVSYPYYSMDDYKKNYEKLATDKTMPLFNRAFYGAYEPGSTFKPAVALIGLQTNTINTDSLLGCNKVYTRFDDYQPSCLGTHGYINVSTAISKSCNCFFFELGYQIGITDLNKYCKQLGLGSETGVEIGESTGILAGPEYADRVGKVWNAGDTIQAAIGQSDNNFTPLQLAQYTATLASGGTRYKNHLIKSICSYSLNKTVKSDFISVLNQTDISADAYRAVKEGMLRVTEDGTAHATFGDYSIKVAGKTGTAQSSSGIDNAVFIGFAPYDDPEIAISIIIENGGHGSTIAPVAKSIFDAYFYNLNDVYIGQESNTLLP